MPPSADRGQVCQASLMSTAHRDTYTAHFTRARPIVHSPDAPITNTIPQVKQLHSLHRSVLEDLADLRANTKRASLFPPGFVLLTFSMYVVLPSRFGTVLWLKVAASLLNVKFLKAQCVKFDDDLFYDFDRFERRRR